MSNNSETVTISFPNHGDTSEWIAGHAFDAIRSYCAEGLKESTLSDTDIDIYTDTIKGLKSSVTMQS